MLLAYSTLWRDKLRPEVRVRAALFSDNSALCALRFALSALVSALIGKRFDRISAVHPPVPPCSVSLSFSAPPLSGESGRARVPDDAFRDRARRSHAGQYLYGISLGAVPRRNRKSSLFRPAFVGRKRTSAGAGRCISGSGAAQSRGSIPIRYQPQGCTVMLGSLPFHAPPLSGESDERGCRTMYFGIGRGAVTRVNTCTVLAAGLYRAGTESLPFSRPAFVGRQRTSAGAGRCISGSGAAQSRGSIPVRYQPRGCTVMLGSLPFHAPPLSGESGRARVPDDAFRDRARRSHAGQYLYGISRGAVPRRNRKARPAPAIGRFLPTV